MAEPKQRLGRDDAVLAVHVQNDFCPGGALPVPKGDEVVPVLNRWIRAAREQGARVYASRDWHPLRHPSFESEGGEWPPHCIQDSPGARFHPDLELPADVPIVSSGVRFDHDQYSGFNETGFAELLGRDGVRRLWVGGLALEVCVFHTVMDGLASGFEMHLLRDACRALDEGGGEEAVRKLREAGARIEGGA